MSPRTTALSISLAVIAALCIGLSPALAQCPGRWLPGDSVPGVNGTVYAVATLPGGDIVVGGAFTIAGGSSASNIARWKVSTHNWTPMGTGVTGIVYALAVLSNGDLAVGGVFPVAGGVNASDVARWRPSTNQWFALGSGIGTNGSVYALAATPNGDVIVGGDFVTAGGVSATNVA
jgi:hypothetical protein